MKRFFIWFAIVFAIIILFLFFVYMFISSLFDTEPIVAKNSYVHIRMGGGISEYHAPDPLQEYFRGSAIDLKKIRQILKMAAVDDRIKGVILDISYLQTGFAKLHEMHQTIEEFRKSGKKILAFLELGLTRDYYLATACDSIYLQPDGMLLLTGLAAGITFYKGLFEKIGIEADFEHIGKYKNAPDVYTRQTMTDTQREVIDEILDDRFEDLLSTISNKRGIPKDEIHHLIDNISGFTTQQALNYKLIDDSRYLDEINFLFVNGEEKLSKIYGLDYSRISPTSLGLEYGPRIAVIYCSGSITGGEDTSNPYFGTMLGASRVIRDIKRAADNNSIKAIVLRIDSPGGVNFAGVNIWHAALEAKKKKPLIASISDLGASAAYHIAIAADSIVAQKPSLIGSIGVYAGKFSINNLYDKLGLNSVSLQRGKNARLFSLNSTFSDSERKIIRRMIDDTYKNFVTAVAESRKKSFEEINNIAQGRVWSGERGLQNGLIDNIGGLDKAISIAKEMANIDEKVDVRLIYYPRRKSALSQVLKNIAITSKNILNPIKQIEDYLKTLQNIPIAIMPYTINLN
jgi:protease-4